MSFDFSILQDIDFTNKENLLFLALFLLLGIIIFFVIIFIIAKIIKAIQTVIRRLYVGMFHPEVRAPSFTRKEGVGGGSIGKINNLAEQRIIDSLSQGSSFTRKKQPSLDPVNIEKEEKKEKEDESDEKEHEKESAKNIEKGLSQLNKIASGDGQTMQSRMPSRTDETQEDIGMDAPRPKHSLASGLQPMGAQSDFGNIGHSKAARESSQGPLGDSSIFKGEQEISKRELEYRMKTESGVFQAAKGEGLNLSPTERAKLVKEVFSSEFGENISRSDLKSGIRKLNQKLASTKDPTEHAKIRKEVKFFKKIGGVK